MRSRSECSAASGQGACPQWGTTRAGGRRLDQGGFLALTCLALLPLVASCGSNRQLSGVPPEDHQVSHELPIEELLRFDEPVELTGAFWDGSTLYLSYRADDQMHYGFSNAEAQQTLSIHTDWVSTYQVFPMDEADFAEKTVSTFELRVLSAAQWQEVRAAVAEAVTPHEPEQGVLFNARDSEYFLYRDSDGRVVQANMFDKPADIELTDI